MIKADTAGIGNLARRLQAVDRSGCCACLLRRPGVCRARQQDGAKREITAVYGLPQKRVDDGLVPRAVGTDIVTTASAKGVTLQSFGGRQTKRGYSAAVLRGKRQVIRKGFTPASSAFRSSASALRDCRSRSCTAQAWWRCCAIARFPSGSWSAKSIRAREELTRRIFRSWTSADGPRRNHQAIAG